MTLLWNICGVLGLIALGFVLLGLVMAIAFVITYLVTMFRDTIKRSDTE